MPQFAHIPLILGQDKSKLSKRHAAVAVMSYHESGFLPEALVNFLARLGWSHGDQEVFTQQELIESFTLEGVGKSSGVFNTEKLLWLNQHYLKEADPARLGDLLLPHLAKLGIQTENDEHLHKIIRLQQERSKTLAKMAETITYYFVDEVTYDEKAARKFLKPETADLLEELLPRFETLDVFEPAALEPILHDFTEQKELKLGKIAQPIRIALTGGSASPGLFDVMAILGKTTVIQRIRRVIAWIRENQ